MTDVSSQKIEIARVNTPAAIGAGLVLVGGALALGYEASWRQGALALVGGALGLSLYHSLFGFTMAWRAFIVERRGAGVRAQMLMLGVATALFFPALARGAAFGEPVRGEFGPVGVSVAVGAFLFGVGMQIAGGCASGTLSAVGGGNIRMLVTLGSFIAGSTLGAAHLPFWSAQWNVGAISLVERLGWAPALMLHLVLFAAIAGASAAAERRRRGRLSSAAPTGRPGRPRFIGGPWPLAWGAIALALGNFATLYLAGRPWGITSAFALWGCKVLAATGVDVAAWPYWQVSARASALRQSVIYDVTSVMDFGLVFGALLAAGLAGKFTVSLRLQLRPLAAALVGGMLLGYGARLGHGCNVGAFFSGIASSSLHGWLWLAAAFPGSIVGVKLRPLFGLSVGRAPSHRSSQSEPIGADPPKGQTLPLIDQTLAGRRGGRSALT